MTRSSLPSPPRLWKSQKWFGRLLGCMTLKHVACSSRSRSDIDLLTSQPDIKENKAVKRYNKLTAARGSHNDGVPVLLGVQRLDEMSTVAIPHAVGLGMFGELELALHAEGLLEYRDPEANMPVLNIGYGFTNDELRAQSKRCAARCSKTVAQWKEQWPCELKGCPKLLSGECYLEPVIDGLPASVWLECVEPTLSILISLNSLRHRRSNLSIKKGLPDTLDSNRSRHGDFEFGPIAIFHQPGRIQQMMLLRVEFLNAAAAAATAGNSYNRDVNQSAEHNGRRTFNRHRRFRLAQSDEILADDVANVLTDVGTTANNRNNNNEQISLTSGQRIGATDVNIKLIQNVAAGDVSTQTDILNFHDQLCLLELNTTEQDAQSHELTPDWSCQVSRLRDLTKPKQQAAETQQQSLLQPQGGRPGLSRRWLDRLVAVHVPEVNEEYVSSFNWNCNAKPIEVENESAVGTLVKSSIVLGAVAVSSVSVPHIAQPAPLQSLGIQNEAAENEEEEVDHDDGGDNELKRLVPASTTGASEVPPSAPAVVPAHSPVTTAVTPSSQPAPSSNSAITDFHTPMNRSQTVDVLALGDYTLWSLLPEQQGRYLHTRHASSLSHPTQSSGSRLYPPGRLHLWNYSRNLVRRARSAISRWKVRMEHSKATRERDGRRGYRQD